MKTRLTLIAALFLIVLPAFALNAGGVLTRPTVWKPSDNPVIINAHLEIPESLSLRIEAGTQIKFDGYYHILVRGSLEAAGTAGREIEFTSNKEKPAAEDWEGIIFYGESAKGFLQSCKVRYAFKNFIWKASPVIQDCYFSNNNYAIYCSYVKALKLLGNQIVKNAFGIYCDFSSPLIQKNKITQNNYGIYCVLSSAPVVGENEIVANLEKDIYMDESMGKNKTENITNQVWDLMKGLF